MNKKLAELSEDELRQVTGGFVERDGLPPINKDEKYVFGFNVPDEKKQYEIHVYSSDVNGDTERR